MKRVDSHIRLPIQLNGRLEREASHRDMSKNALIIEWLTILIDFNDETRLDEKLFRKRDSK